jgi:hypothetical protein
MDQASVWLAIPHAGLITPGPLRACLYATRRHRLTVKDLPCSVAVHGFNQLWCQAYEHRRALKLTHFAMIHAEVGPDEWWLDTLLSEMDRVGADVISAIIAVKDPRGLTSTGVRTLGDWRTRRLTMREVMRLPGTFSADDLGEPGRHLGLNTGLWACRYGDWVREFPGFKIRSEVNYDAAADRLVAGVDSEDWLWSDWCHSRGLRLFATRKVTVRHDGMTGYPNDRAWGEWETDREFQ